MATVSIRVREETGEDRAGVRVVLEEAFPSPVEAQLVDQLRANGKATISLVAESDDGVVGHILFSPVEIEGAGTGLGLAPVAVRPDAQGQGVGSRLIREGLARCARAAVPFVVVLGAPAYYGRFGFGRASARGLSNEYGVDAEFMVQELTDGALPAAGGLVRYAREFGAVGGDATDPDA